MTVRIYLDDVRKAPDGWQRVKTADACIAALKCGGVDELSLDHDLADEHYPEASAGMYGGNGAPQYDSYREKTGFAVVEWMIENDVWPSLIILHTMNPVGRDNMRRAIERHAPKGVTCEVRVGFRG
jgi:hypothetical protein